VPARIKVLVVDDSALVRKVLHDVLSEQPDIEVVGCAPDPLFARDMIKTLNPDVLTLDVEMPRMDGLDFLGRLMRLRPMPVVMVSSLTERGSEATLRALELGAVDFIAKPRMGIEQGLTAYADALAEKIRIAASARLRKAPALEVGARVSADAILPPIANRITSTEKLIVIGASTGGTEAIADVLTRMPADSPAILIAQHMPPGFTASFARRLDGLCRVRVKEAEHGERVLPGHAYLAPGHSHLLLARSGANYLTELNTGPAVNRHRPSVDVLFRSAANSAGKNAIGVILTGMGKDGAAGLLEMRRQGAHTIAQDEASCVVFGMPREAIALGAAAEEATLAEIAPRILKRLALFGERAVRV
jgi:two-component system chemotaxis response regulator CheB